MLSEFAADAVLGILLPFAITALHYRSGDVQPRTQAQITKNRHTTVFLYRSVAKLSERAGVLGEDAGNEAPGRICNKHGGHEDANEEIAVLYSMKLKDMPIERDIWERFYAQMITALIIIIFPRKRYYIFIILAGEFLKTSRNLTESLLSPGHDLFQMVENICLVLDAHHEMYCLFAV